MRLVSALASGFLFVPIGLADYGPKKHQPRFLNSVNNDAYVNSEPLAWSGGARYSEAGLFCTDSYTSSTAMFNAPLAWGDDRAGIGIEVDIGGSVDTCRHTNVSFAAGIDVFLTDSVVSYAAWATWGSDVRSPLKLDIVPGDFIQVTLVVNSPTNGSALLQNLSTGQSWWEIFTGAAEVCQGSVQWIMTELVDQHNGVMTVPRFGTVTFLDATAQLTENGTTVTAGGAQTQVNGDIKFTSVMAQGDVVVVALGP